MLNDYTTIRIGQKMVNDLRRLYSQIQRLSFSSPPSGGRSTLPVDLRYLRDPDAHDERPFPGVVLSTLFVGMFLVMIHRDPLLTLFYPHHMSDSICLSVDDLAMHD